MVSLKEKHAGRGRYYSLCHAHVYVVPVESVNSGDNRSDDDDV